MENKVKDSLLMWIQKTSLTIILKDALLWLQTPKEEKDDLQVNIPKRKPFSPPPKPFIW